MRDIAAVASLAVLATFGVTAASWDGTQHEVSKEQYKILIAQCRYAQTGKASCRAAVKARYRIGQPDKSLDCRTYSGVSVCGTLHLSKAQRACAQESVSKGLSYRRAEVECYAFA
ncbi:hypothetical protein [Nonomuraea jiangxiensis]|uniref:Uncharacterized protein n=1 Tax=Nonomuraea jiangxiensis TaxID=633440 RepID=A0A1G8UKS3_9ACTN|nr:hypothetical protein [Nonomuraea jiangxiensis]SDJ54373.1 hypothetical protein SAMN05421869_11119 [Nonomuraea jiangxiensis]